MNNYNSSSYYRANPYKDIGYMPPMAQKNRRSPEHSGQIPQGQQYFEPSAKKHYGYSYYNEIEGDRVLRAADPMSPLEREAMQRSYFRSLNSKDIEGSSTNTLISKAVKNKLKAQQELQRRKEAQRQAAQVARQQRESEQKTRQQYIQNYHKQMMTKSQPREQPNSSQGPVPHYEQSQAPGDQRKRREIELLRLAQQRKNYALVEFPAPLNNQEVPAGNASVVVQSQPNFHQNQLQKRRKTERDREQEQEQNQGDKKHNGQNSSLLPVDRDQRNLHNYYNDSLEDVRNGAYSYPKQEVNYGFNLEPRSHLDQGYHAMEKDEIRKYQNYSLPYQNISPVTQLAKKESMKVQEPYPGGNNLYGQQVYQQIQPFRNREELRRHNPTYLSYGSPTFGVASRNVIGR